MAREPCGITQDLHRLAPPRARVVYPSRRAAAAGNAQPRATFILTHPRGANDTPRLPGHKRREEREAELHPSCSHFINIATKSCARAVHNLGRTLFHSTRSRLPALGPRGATQAGHAHLTCRPRAVLRRATPCYANAPAAIRLGSSSLSPPLIPSGSSGRGGGGAGAMHCVWGQLVGVPRASPQRPRHGPCLPCPWPAHYNLKLRGWPRIAHECPVSLSFPARRRPRRPRRPPPPQPFITAPSPAAFTFTSASPKPILQAGQLFFPLCISA